MFKKFISLFLVFVLLMSVFTCTASAFGGYMHWTIASVRMELDDAQTLSDNVKLAYKSGCLLADFGRLLLDPFNDFDTDDLDFTQAIYNLAMSQNSQLARAFAFGWRDHYIHDNTGTAEYLYYDDPELKGPYEDYTKNCGWIDEYLRDELQPVDDYPIQSNSVSQLYVNYDLIRAAFVAMGDSAPSELTINANIIAMCEAFDLAILGNNKEWTDAQASRICLEVIEMALCSYGVNAMSPSSLLSNFDISETEQLDYYEPILTEQEVAELSQYFRIEKTDISEGEAFVTIINTDVENYKSTLNRIAYEKTMIIEEPEIY